jgi:hypothetical protein
MIKFIYCVQLKLHGTHQLLVGTDDKNLLGDNIDTIKKKTELKTKLPGF